MAQQHTVGDARDWCNEHGFRVTESEFKRDPEYVMELLEDDPRILAIEVHLPTEEAARAMFGEKGTSRTWQLGVPAYAFPDQSVIVRTPRGFKATTLGAVSALGGSASKRSPMHDWRDWITLW